MRSACAVIKERLVAFARLFGKRGAHVDNDDDDGPTAKPKPVAEKRATKGQALQAIAEPAAAVATIEGASPFVEVAQKYTPPGYTFECRKEVSGMHFGERKLIQTCKPLAAKSLYIFLHECAHAHLGHSHNGKAARHVEEMQAEQFAHKAMAESGIPVPPEMTTRGKRHVAWKRYVARKIVQAQRRGATQIDPEALAYAGPNLVAETHANYEKWYGPPGRSRIRFRRR